MSLVALSPSGNTLGLVFAQKEYRVDPNAAAWARVSELVARSTALLQRSRVIHAEAERIHSRLETLYQRAERLGVPSQGDQEEYEP